MGLHAKASEVTVELLVSPDTLSLTIHDNGIGMSVGESKTEMIPSDSAFGPYRPELSCQVHRSWFHDQTIEPQVGLAGCGKTQLMPKTWLEYSVWRWSKNTLRMLKKAVQQGRSERGGEAYASVR